MQMYRTLRTTAALAAVLAMVACGDKPLTSAASAEPALQTIAVATGDGAGGIAWDGVVQAVDQAVLSAQTGGRVIGPAVDVNARVAAGAVLLRLTSQEQGAAVATARAQLQVAEAHLADARSRFQRASELIGRQLISRDEFDRVKAASEAGSAARDAAAAVLAQAQQQLGYTVIRAPYAGVVSARQVEPGETVVPGQPLYTLYAPGQLRLEVQLPQADADAVREDATATITLADTRKIAAAKVIVFPSADPLAHSSTVRVLLPALPSPPRPGQTAKVRFRAAAAPAGIWLPQSAIVMRGELSGAYVVTDNSVVLRQLRLGSTAGDRVQVLAGLEAGDRVAADPVAALQTLRARQAETRP
jgi:RND family efflux transporter MFP subunit